MSNLLKRIQINEEGPRDGFQFERGSILTAGKVEQIDSLSRTGLKQIHVASFVNPKAVSGLADTDGVIARFKSKPSILDTALSLKDKRLQRAIACGRLDVNGSLALTAYDIPVERISTRAAFGCNFERDVPAGYPRSGSVLRGGSLARRRAAAQAGAFG